MKTLQIQSCTVIGVWIKEKKNHVDLKAMSKESHRQIETRTQGVYRPYCLCLSLGTQWNVQVM